MWKNGKMHGLGVEISKDGERSEGEWRDGKRNKWTGSAGGGITEERS